MPGYLVLVVGPSGAGKDSILRAAAQRLACNPRFVFPRRIITRTADVSAEDHDTLTEEEFHRSVKESRFALWWEAHGNLYGIGVELAENLAAGRIVVANVSRAVITGAAERFANVMAIEVTAPREVLASRLASRRRESVEDRASRLARPAPPFPPHVPMISIENAGPLDQAVAAFCTILERLDRNLDAA